LAKRVAGFSGWAAALAGIEFSSNEAGRASRHFH